MPPPNSIPLTPDQRAQIDRKVAETLEGAPHEITRRVCGEFRSLPLFADASATMALGLDGELRWIDHDEPHAARPVEDDRMRNLGLHQGALAHPDLDFLEPKRPESAVDCPDCRGTGRVDLPGLPESARRNVVCSCGGLGWVPGPAEPSRPRRVASRPVVLMLLAFVLVAPPAILALARFGFLPYSGANSWGGEVDIRSGRFRKASRLLWFRSAGPALPTALTNALKPEDWSRGAADWRPATTFSPGLVVPAPGPFRSAIDQAKELELCWEVGKATPEARRQSARVVLRLWQEGQDDVLARDYLAALGEKALAAEDAKAAIDVGELPAPPPASPR